ncbi:DNA helicase PcrA [[Ruminococcus] torques]|uniref:DNA helicase PcrA n=1 Tax=[Ruminococcus] torques TaxID=33039 RepID=UPI0032C075D7
MAVYDTLNKPQKEAVFHTEGPLLILAGAGSGKTRVLTHRIAYLIEEKGVNPWNILAITFTNKAAEEMRQRVDSLVGIGAESIWVSTFHSMCVRILRRYIDRLGYDNRFTIYDTDDQKTLMKEVCRKTDIDTKRFKERMLLSVISSAKNEMILPEEFELNAGGDFVQLKIAKVYKEYEAQMRANNALDFDDLLVKTVQLLETQPDVRENYQERFRYIMVDEYQDTNTVQFRLVSLLAGKYRNLCVVGDDDQSIYKFRGANIRNILDFEKEFSDAKVIKLEQNYRSVGNVLEVANSVIRNNKGRKEKTLWTDNEKGEKIRLRQFDTAYDEAQFIAEDIKDETAQGANYSDHAVLYRTNAQSRLLEEKFVAMNIPYKIVGGINFYSRREIKDVLSYLKTIDNGKDDLAVRRIINVPKRGIGLTTINRIQESAAARGIGFYDALSAPDLIPGIGRSASKLDSFAALIEYFKGRSEESGVTDLLTEVIEKTGYTESLEADDPEELEARVQNIDELVSKAAVYEESCSDRGERPTLSGFLEEVALVADIDSVAEDRDYVILMTLHSAKGLEFPHVYLAGMEDGLFPSYMSISGDDPEELEEERRLCYVGVTRAEEKLTLTCARMRLVRGERQYNSMSRFIKEMPSALIDTGKREGGFSQNVSLGEKRTHSSEVSGYKRSAYAQKPAFAAIQKGSGLMAKKSEGLSYGVGDRVRHVKFGDGTVTEIKEGGRDYEVTVQFDTAGVRKMFALFAKLIKI